MTAGNERWLTDDEAETLVELLSRLQGEIAAVNRRELNVSSRLRLAAQRKNYWKYLNLRYFDRGSDQ